MKHSLWNALRHKTYYLAHEALGIPVRPRKLRLAVTNRCNARCRTCEVWKLDHAGENDLSLEEYERIFRGNANYLSRVSHLSLTGGEPFLRKDLADIVRLVKRCLPQAGININTNGFLTERIVELAQGASKEKIALMFNISLDGMDAKHDESRGVAGAANMAHRTIERLARMQNDKCGVRVGINHLMTEHNPDECEVVWKYCRDLGIRFNPILPMSGELYHNEGLSVALPESARAPYAEVFRRLMPEEKSRQLEFGEILHQLEGRARDFRCWAGSVVILIEENGEVFPNGGCPRDWNFGNLRECDYRFSRLLSTDKARDVFRKVKHCRACRLACETLTTLKYPEALAAKRKMRDCKNRFPSP
jgi:MoaA/NifB/PqqE/SkfB family radical SAM enzyme